MTPASTEEFQAALTAVARAVDNLLDELLPAMPHNRLRDAMRHAVLGPGKRLRPFLVVESARLFGVPDARALRVGAALEALHCYSLVHDDLPAMDNDDLRRGQPTTHRKFDEATAILAGDGLLTWSFEILADEAIHPLPEVRVKLIAALSMAAGRNGMVGGQMLDIEAETSGFRDFQHIAAMQDKKTGALFRFACEAGAILAQADSSLLRQYADHIGLAFQIADDILDVESSSEALGKATQKDSSKGKATFVDLLGLEGARIEAARLVEKAVVTLQPYGEKSRMLVATASFIVSRRK